MEHDDSAVNYLTPEQIRGKQAREGRPMALRDRIAAALWDFACPEKLKGQVPVDDVFYKMADAVIAALGLRIQVAGPDGIVGTGNYRYVTEWENNE